MTQISAWFVVLMGIGTVFVGLVCLVLICSVLGLILSKKKDKPAQEQEVMDPAKKQEFLAVMTAAIAAKAGTDPGYVRFISVKKVK